MKQRDEVKREFVRQWLAKAEADLRVCRHLLAGGEELAEAAAFHAQQAAEKSLKALLVWHQIEFTKTHDLGAILERVATVERRLAEKMTEVPALTPYAARYRYPSDVPDPSVEEADRAVGIAAAVFREVVLRLPPEARPERGKE